ncbi:MAG: pyruvate dehydrogenase (acetyl-transferring) E1 component subunit alpha [Chromatiales bacterium]
MKTVAKFEIPYTQFLDPEGNLIEPLPSAFSDAQSLLPLYRTMVLTRTFDRKAIALQRTGQLGTYASPLGQEAVGVGVGHAMRPEDVLLPSYRDYAAQFVRGISPVEILLYWGGDERGMDYKGPREDFPICVPVGTHACHAVGIAYAFRYRRESRVAVAIMGDGATSKGDFYESINVAGAWQLPVVFVINNNQWAISVPRAAQSAAQTLAQKAIAAGFSGEQIDGNDVIAVRHVTAAAIEKARAGGGPTLVECLSYRLGDHTTADDASRYRDPAEVEAQRRLDAVARLKSYLAHAGVWDEAREQELQRENVNEVEDAVRRYQAIPAQPPESMFDHLYETLPAALADQRREVAGSHVGEGENARAYAG